MTERQLNAVMIALRAVDTRVVHYSSFHFGHVSGHNHDSVHLDKRNGMWRIQYAPIKMGGYVIIEDRRPSRGIDRFERAMLKARRLDALRDDER